VAAPGKNYNRIVVVNGDPEATMQDLTAAVSGAQGYTANMGGKGSLVLTRRYTPTWAIVLAIIGLLVFLLGMLFLLVKKTETVSVSLRPVVGGTEVRVSGVASPELQARLNAVFEAKQAPVVEGGAPATLSASEEALPQLEERLARLGKMKEDGLIDESEYAQQRERLLGSI
jgi:hypothetical protein